MLDFDEDEYDDDEDLGYYDPERDRVQLVVVWCVAGMFACLVTAAAVALWG